MNKTHTTTQKMCILVLRAYTDCHHVTSQKFHCREHNQRASKLRYKVLDCLVSRPACGRGWRRKRYARNGTCQPCQVRAISTPRLVLDCIEVPDEGRQSLKSRVLSGTTPNRIHIGRLGIDQPLRNERVAEYNISELATSSTVDDGKRTRENASTRGYGQRQTSLSQEYYHQNARQHESSPASSSIYSDDHPSRPRPVAEHHARHPRSESDGDAPISRLSELIDEVEAVWRESVTQTRREEEQKHVDA